MGAVAPEEGELVRIVLELKGRPGLTQQEYKAYKKAIADIVSRYHAEMAAGEYVVVEKRPKKKGGK